MKQAALTTLALIVLAASIFAQQLEYREVDWAFPESNIQTKQINGKLFYVLRNEVYGFVDAYKGHSIRAVSIPAKITLAAELVHQQDPQGMPNVDKFLAAFAVSLVVVTPEGYDNVYIGSGSLDDSTVYLFTTKSGANVGAVVSPERNGVVVIPALSRKP